jgi:hypothetical protein
MAARLLNLKQKPNIPSQVSNTGHISDFIHQFKIASKPQLDCDLFELVVTAA